MKKEKGLFNKFNLQKADGSKINPDARYFVLRYDNAQKDADFARASRRALFTFISEIHGSNPELAKELFRAIKEANPPDQ